MSLQLRFVSHSEIGPVRKNNQDSGYVSPLLLVVADGMGGAAAGDLASAVAIDTVKGLDPGPSSEPSPDPSTSSGHEVGPSTSSGHEVGPSTGSGREVGPSTSSGRDTTSSGNDPLEQLSAAIRRANERIAELITDDHRLEGMGTTLTMALFDGEQMSLAHIGDSRAYLLRDDRLERLTHDHSWVQSLVDDGKISEAEASVHPHRSLLLKVLNGQPANDPDLTTVRLQAGDRVLFCSDGICGLVEDPEIQAALQVPDLNQALDQLVDDALAEGGIDNITAIVADVVEGGGGGVTAVLGAAAERAIPEIGARKHTDDSSEDTLIRARAAVPPRATEPDTADEARYNPQPPRGRRALRVLVGVLALAIIAGAGLGAGWAWTRNQFFVGASDQRVAIFQGLPESLPGIELSSVYEIQPLLLSTLPVYYQNMVTTGIEVDSLDAARRTVAELTETAKRCAQPTPSPTPRPTSAPPPSASGSAVPPPATSRPPTPPRSTVIGPTVPVSPGSASSTLRPTPSATPSPTASPRPEC